MGTSLRTVQEVLGHVDLKTTSIYASWRKKRSRGSYKRMLYEYYASPLAHT